MGRGCLARRVKEGEILTFSVVRSQMNVANRDLPALKYSKWLLDVAPAEIQSITALHVHVHGGKNRA